MPLRTTNVTEARAAHVAEASARRAYRSGGDYYGTWARVYEEAEYLLKGGLRSEGMKQPKRKTRKEKIAESAAVKGEAKQQAAYQRKLDRQQAGKADKGAD